MALIAKHGTSTMRYDDVLPNDRYEAVSKTPSSFAINGISYPLLFEWKKFQVIFWYESKSSCTTSFYSLTGVVQIIKLILILIIQSKYSAVNIEAWHTSNRNRVHWLGCLSFFFFFYYLRTPRRAKNTETCVKFCPEIFVNILKSISKSLLSNSYSSFCCHSRYSCRILSHCCWVVSFFFSK